MAGKTALLIPAYNEATRLGKVLEVVCNYPRPLQILVIDDGSTDATAAEAQQYPVDIISFPRNRGKGAALQAGIQHLGRAPYWIFLDADLINLENRHLDALLDPLQENPDTAMSVGIFRGGRSNTDLAHRFFGILNGQRGLSDFFVSHLPDLSWSHFGVEIFLSKYAAYQGYRVDYPTLAGLTHYTKESKFGFPRGFAYRLQMYRECIYSLFFWKKYVNTAAPSVEEESHP